MSHRIRILAMSDVHGRVFPHSYADGAPVDGGYARLKRLIDFLRDDHTIVIDNGDSIQGSPLTFFHHRQRRDKTCPVSLALRTIGTDFVNAGNHDFNEGTEVLFSHLKESGAKCITSNFIYRGAPVSPPYVMRSLCGKRVAFFGVTTQYIPNWEPEAHLRDTVFSDAFETAKETVANLKALGKDRRPDYIVGVYHGGFERDPETGEATGTDTGEDEGFRMITEIDGLDVLITGHQHRVYCGKRDGTVYTQPGVNGKLLSVIDIDTLSGTITPRLIAPEEEADEALLALVQEEEDACQAWLDTPLGETRTDLSVADAFEARLHKSQVITFLNRIQMETTGADIAATALFHGATGFGTRITMRDLVSTYVFPNTVVVKRVTGAVLRAYLEQSARYWTLDGNGRIAVSDAFLRPVPKHFDYDMADGVEYTINVSNPPGERITSLTRNGKPVTDADVFTLAVNNYRAAGGGDYGMLRSAETVSENLTDMTELIADYIMKYPVIAFEPVENIRVIRD